MDITMIRRIVLYVLRSFQDAKLVMTVKNALGVPLQITGIIILLQMDLVFARWGMCKLANNAKVVRCIAYSASRLLFVLIAVSIG